MILQKKNANNDSQVIKLIRSGSTHTGASNSGEISKKIVWHWAFQWGRMPTTFFEISTELDAPQIKTRVILVWEKVLQFSWSFQKKWFSTIENVFWTLQLSPSFRMRNVASGKLYRKFDTLMMRMQNSSRSTLVIKLTTFWCTISYIQRNPLSKMFHKTLFWFKEHVFPSLVVTNPSEIISSISKRNW